MSNHFCVPCDGYGVVVNHVNGQTVKCPYCDGKQLDNNTVRELHTKAHNITGALIPDHGIDGIGAQEVIDFLETIRGDQKPSSSLNDAANRNEESPIHTQGDARMKTTKLAKDIVSGDSIVIEGVPLRVNHVYDEGKLRNNVPIVHWSCSAIGTATHEGGEFYRAHHEAVEIVEPSVQVIVMLKRSEAEHFLDLGGPYANESARQKLRTACAAALGCDEAKGQ